MRSGRGAIRLRQTAVALAIAAGAPLHALSQEIPGYAGIDAYDPREIALLPEYCKYTQTFRANVRGGSNAAEMRRWESQLGPAFEHLHHYCWGLMKTNRALYLARSGTVREFYFSDSIGEFDYIIRRSPPDFVLLPEILTKKGENLIRLGKAPSGIHDLERAAELKPDYWPPYAQMSDFYKASGDRQKARELLERGLSFAPDAVALKRRLAELNTSTRPPAKGDAKKGNPGSGGG